MTTVMSSTVEPEQRPGEIPKRLTVWFNCEDHAAVREVLDRLGTRQVGAVQGILAFLDPLLSSTAAIVEMHYAFGASRHIGDDEAHPREQLFLAPLHLGYHPPGAVPTPRLVPEVVVPDDRFLRRPSHRPPQQRGDLPLKHLVAGEPDGG